MPLYRLPSGLILAQGGHPVNLTQEQFEECCCGSESESSSESSSSSGSSSDIPTTGVSCCVDEIGPMNMAATFNVSGDGPCLAADGTWVVPYVGVEYGYQYVSCVWRDTFSDVVSCGESSYDMTVSVKIGKAFAVSDWLMVAGFVLTGLVGGRDYSYLLGEDPLCLAGPWTLTYYADYGTLCLGSDYRCRGMMISEAAIVSPSS